MNKTPHEHANDVRKALDATVEAVAVARKNGVVVQFTFGPDPKTGELGVLDFQVFTRLKLNN